MFERMGIKGGWVGITVIFLFFTWSNFSQNQGDSILKAALNNKKTKEGDKEGPEEKNQDVFQSFRTISEVFHLISDRHYTGAKFSSFVEKALKSALPSLDAHSSFFSKESYRVSRESTAGEFSGLGIGIMSKAPEDEYMIIIDVVQDGPADKVGLECGDKIVEIEGEMIKGVPSDEVVDKLRGKIGSKVEIKVIRNKQPMEFSIKRDTIKDQASMCYRFNKQNIYYFGLKSFSETAPNQMKELLKKTENENCSGIILDLRRNPGGVLDPTTIDIAGLFLEKDSVVVKTKDRSGKAVNTYRTTGDPVFKKNVPIFIAVDNFSASASEIFAGCMKHYSDKSENSSGGNLRVFLVGTETFGKGSVQEVIPVSGGCALKLTVNLYYLPDDSCLQAKGIKPDFTVHPKAVPKEEIQWIKELYGKETSLKHHIPAQGGNKPEKEKGGKTKNDKESKEEIVKNWEKKSKKNIGQDIQIQACVNMIRMLNSAEKSDPLRVCTRSKALSFLKDNYLTDDEVEIEQVK